MRILLTGARGQLGSYLAPKLQRKGHDVLAIAGPSSPGPDAIDLVDSRSTRAWLDSASPDAILHLAAISSAEQARRDPARAMLVNVEATKTLADWSGNHDRRLVFTSTDLVFDGSRPWNREDDPAEPILTYGQTKRAAEASVQAISGGLVARLSLLYGRSRSGRESFFDQTLAALRRGEPRTAFEDEFRTPLDLDTAADLLILLLESTITGLLHVAGPERLSRFDLLRRVALASGMNADLVVPNRQADANFPEPRPVDVSLDTTRLSTLFPDYPRPTIEQAMIRSDWRQIIT